VAEGLIIRDRLNGANYGAVHIDGQRRNPGVPSPIEMSADIKQRVIEGLGVTGTITDVVTYFVFHEGTWGEIVQRYQNEQQDPTLYTSSFLW
jgi:hypothetical protein